MSTITASLTNQTTSQFVTSTLIDLLQSASEASIAQIQQEFDHWSQVIDSAPLNAEEYVFAHNWLSSAHELWQQGEVPTAIYQLKQVAKKLSI